jgi:hypothetical protein
MTRWSESRSHRGMQLALVLMRDPDGSNVASPTELERAELVYTGHGYTGMAGFGSGLTRSGQDPESSGVCSDKLE